MPLTKVENINGSSWWALWNITESFEELCEKTRQTDLESFYLENISHLNKKKEWLASRLILSYLTEKMGSKYYGCYKDEFGKPHLTKQTLQVSITNSFPFAAGIICQNKPVGIDLEQPKEKLIKTAPKFLNIKEIKDAEQHLEKLCLYWCAKETIYKCYGRKNISLKENIFIDPFNLKSKGSLTGYIKTPDEIFKFNLFYMFFMSGYVLSFNTNGYLINQ
jgi:4'-phosphopantetheinyl transferase